MMIFWPKFGINSELVEVSLNQFSGGQFESRLSVWNFQFFSATTDASKNFQISLMLLAISLNIIS